MSLSSCGRSHGQQLGTFGSAWLYHQGGHRRVGPGRVNQAWLFRFQASIDFMGEGSFLLFPFHPGCVSPHKAVCEGFPDGVPCCLGHGPNGSVQPTLDSCRVRLGTAFFDRHGRFYEGFTPLVGLFDFLPDPKQSDVNTPSFSCRRDGTR